MDIDKRELFIKISNDVFKIKSSKSTHWKLPIQNHKNLITETQSLVFSVNLNEMCEAKLRKHIVKTHKNLAHKSEEQLITLFQMAGKK